MNAAEQAQKRDLQLSQLLENLSAMTSNQAEILKLQKQQLMGNRDFKIFQSAVVYDYRSISSGGDFTSGKIIKCSQARALRMKARSSNTLSNFTSLCDDASGARDVRLKLQGEIVFKGRLYDLLRDVDNQLDTLTIGPVDLTVSWPDFLVTGNIDPVTGAVNENITATGFSNINIPSNNITSSGFCFGYFDVDMLFDEIHVTGEYFNAFDTFHFTVLK